LLESVQEGDAGGVSVCPHRLFSFDYIVRLCVVIACKQNSEWNHHLEALRSRQDLGSWRVGEASIGWVSDESFGAILG